MKKVSNEYLGMTGAIGFDKTLTEKYNKLLDKIGTDGMLEQFERFIDEGELKDLISQAEDNLLENDIDLPY
jgi:hypothetical protein